MTTLIQSHRNQATIHYRSVALIVPSVPTSDGAGVRINRALGIPALQMLDPFLLLDVFHSDQPQDYLAGFPDHPHRGFETVTYVLAGRVRHEDSNGHIGVVEPGGVQWMTAGRGIVHSEMPEQTDGLLRGFQLWINLPATEKMNPPRYQEFNASEIPMEQRSPNVQVRVIAGQTSLGSQGPVRPRATEPIYLDVAIAPNESAPPNSVSNAVFSETLPTSHTAFLFVYDGHINVHADDSRPGQRVEAGTLAVLGAGHQIHVRADTDGGKFLLIAGKPLNEPVAWSGPFVMNTEAEVLQAYRDYQTGNFQS